MAVPHRNRSGKLDGGHGGHRSGGPPAASPVPGHPRRGRRPAIGGIGRSTWQDGSRERSPRIPGRTCSTSSPSRSTSSAGSNPNEERQRIFGGQVAAQALMAAGRTVDVGRPHSLHAYFLRPGDPNVPVLYEVDRIRDGRSFTTRRVVAIQHGRAIFHLSASFHVDEPGPGPPDPDARGARPRDAAHPARAARALQGQGRRLVRPATPHRPAPHRRAALDAPRRAGAASSGCGCGPTARSPTTRCSTPASPPTPPTCTCSTPCSPPTTWAGTTPTSWGPASTTACGSTGRSGPTSGCSTTWTARRRPGPVAWPGASCSPGTATLAVSMVQEGLMRLVERAAGRGRLTGRRDRPGRYERSAMGT